MLKRGKEIARAAGEAVGILSPNVADAQTAAEQRRQDLVAAQGAIAAAEDELNRLHDRGDATGAQVMAAEAMLADVKLTAERAQRAYTGAEKRLQKAREAELAKSREGVRVKLNEVLAQRAKLAEKIDSAAIALAEALAEFNSYDDLIRRAMAVGVVGRDATYTLNLGRRVVDLALRKRGALYEGTGTGNIELPGAVELVAQHNGALSAA
jgi:paraquat-inducible protein B